MTLVGFATALLASAAGAAGLDAKSCSTGTGPVSAKNAEMINTCQRLLYGEPDPVVAAQALIERDCLVTDGKASFTERKLIPHIEEKIKKNWPGTTGKDDGMPVDLEDWINIELLARLIYAELGSTPAAKCPDAYLKAIGRIVLNLSQFSAKDETGRYKQFIDKNKRSDWIGSYTTEVITKYGAFSSLLSTDPANRMFLCPQTTPNDPENYAGWRRSLKTAVDIIVHRERFLKETSEVKSLFYTDSGVKIDPKFTLVTGVHVDGIEINNPKCIQLWKDPDLKRTDLRTRAQ